MYTTIRMFGNSKIFSPKMKNDHHLLIWYDFKNIFWRMLQIQKHNRTIKQFLVRNYFLKSHMWITVMILLWYFFGFLKFV